MPAGDCSATQPWLASTSTPYEENRMAARFRTLRGFSRRWSAGAALAASGFALLPGAAPSQAGARAPGPGLGASPRPQSPAGRQLGWLLQASARPPLSDAELRAHFSKWFLSTPGQSPAEINSALATLAVPGGLRLDRLTLVQPNAIVGRVTGRDGQALSVALVTDRARRIDVGVLRSAARLPPVTLPAPTGRAPVGRDVVQVIDRTRRGRRLLLTRWYPAASGARRWPRAAYTSPLRVALGLPSARVHARRGARARVARLPVVLFSPGAGTARDLYQGLAEDLASHGYLVVAVDHTGETPVQFPDGHVEGRSVPLRHLIRHRGRHPPGRHAARPAAAEHACPGAASPPPAGGAPPALPLRGG